MNRMRWLVSLAALLSTAASVEVAAQVPPPVEPPMVDLFDTERPLTGKDPSEALRDASGWARVPHDGKTVGLVCELRQAAVFVKAEPRGGTSRLRIESAGRFGVIPDFYADDIVLDATKIPASQAHVPSENMFAQRLEGDVLAGGELGSSLDI